ncbi:MAG TPA: c-type cytochrome, partial [Bacteroidetes bacterium]|nr:c-type cytochrome [Bacteroidota bacterium]
MIMNKFVNVRRLKVIRLTVPLLLFFILFLSSFTTAWGQTPEAEKNFAQCKACHTIGGGRLVGPDLKGVTEKFPEEWLIKFIQNSQAMVKAGDKEAVKIFNEYNKIPMPSHNLTDAQVKDILLYIKNGGKLPAGAVAQKAPAKVAPATVQKISDAERYIREKREGSRNLAIFAIVSAVLLILSLLDLMFTHYLKAKWLHYVIVLSALWILGEWSWDYATGLGRQQNYQPDQPIWFSHKVHAGQNQIDCEYCHFTAERSMHAGIPPASV